MLKNLIKLIAAAALVVSFAACEDTAAIDDSPATKEAAAYGSLESVFDVTDKEDVTVAYLYDSEDPSLSADVPGYSMDQFLTLNAVNALVDVEEAVVDYRSMFCYDIIASDGYSFLTKNSVLGLTDMLTGFYLYDTSETDGKITVDGDLTSPRNYFPSTDIAKGYDIKNAQDIDLYRAIKISSTGVTSINILTDEYVTEKLAWAKIKSGEETSMTNNAVSVESLLYTFSEAVTEEMTAATYLVKCADYDAADDYTYEELTYTQLMSSYFMPAYETVAADGAYEDLIVVMNTTAADGVTPANDDSSLRLKMPVEIVVEF